MTAFGILILSCRVQDKIEYDIPASISTFEREYVLQDLETGRILYKDHCSGCHGIFGKAKPGVPDFAIVEVKDYLEKRMRRAITKNPVSHRITFIMMPEEVNQAMGFIQRYKRK